jgi:hypothetical protein
MLTTDQKGAVAEQGIAFEAIKRGLGVFMPLCDERYDLILDLRPRLVRVQCKWAVRFGRARGRAIAPRSVPEQPGSGDSLGT